MAPVPYPLINGNRFDFSSVEINIAAVLFTGVKALNYKDSLDPGELRGNSAQVLGRTRGKYSAEGSLELYVAEHDQLTTILTAQGKGYLEQTFDIISNYSEVGSPVITDKLIGCRLKTSDNSAAEGNDPLLVKCDLSIMYIIRNGKIPLSAKQFRR